MEKAQGARTELRDNGDVKLKTETLANAGINLRTANRYEELASSRGEQARPAAGKSRRNSSRARRPKAITQISLGAMVELSTFEDI
jgi:hypothetical protein